MPSIDVLEFSIAAESAEKHGGIAAHFGMFAQEIIDVIKNTGRVGAHCHSGKSALKHGREQRRAEAFAGDVRDEKGRAVVAHGKNIEIITSHRQTGKINTADGEMRKIPEAAREQGLLNVARNA